MGAVRPVLWGLRVFRARFPGQVRGPKGGS